MGLVGVTSWPLSNRTMVARPVSGPAVPDMKTVEAGVDFSFRTAVRESCSVASVIQTGGRVNRHGEWAAAEVWDVCLQDPAFNHHSAFDSSRRVLKEMLEEGQIDSRSEE